MRLFRFYFILTVLLIPITTSAQSLIVGYNAGYGFARDLNRELYIYNAINGHQIKKEMGPAHWFKGPTAGFRIGNEAFYELLYTWKACNVHSEFDSANVPFVRQLRVYQYSFQHAMGIRVGNVSFGASVDYGRFRGKGRRGPESGIKDQEWEMIWKNENPFGLLSLVIPTRYTLFTEFHWGLGAVRLFCQFAPMQSDLGYLDHWLFGTYLNYGKYMRDHFTNFGVMVSLHVGRN
jgi:hypothetical protein